MSCQQPEVFFWLVTASSEPQPAAIRRSCSRRHRVVERLWRVIGRCG
jgi:hypothetical protein